MANYGIPYFSTNSKASVGFKMRIGFTGVLIHGIGSRVFLHHKHWPNDPNMTIEVLHRTLSSLNSIPPILYLQVLFIININRWIIVLVKIRTDMFLDI